MLAIKLQRVGKKHQPSYRVVVAEKKSKMGAPPVEDLGSYSTQTKKAQLKTERVQHWISVGAQPTATIHNLLVNEGLLKRAKLQMKFKVPEKAPVAEVPAAVSAPAEKPAETPADETAKV